MAAADDQCEPAPLQRWLSIVGIGEDGVDGLGRRARQLIEAAEIIFGGARHLALARDLIRGEAAPWPTPFEPGIEAVAARRGRRVCVLASGDPFQFGVGATLLRHVPIGEIEVVPAVSSFSLATARLGWPLPDTVTLSVHGRAIDLVRPHLHPASRLLVLTSDGEGPAALAALLTKAGFGPSEMTVLEALGGPRERIRSQRADTFEMADISALNLVGIEVFAADTARVLAFTPGLADDLYEHDGQLTKHEVRALTLAALAPKRGQVLWDIGAGAGSIGIEWMLCDPSLEAFAIEAHTERAARIRRNARAFGVPGLRVIEGAAPQALGGLPQPDAIFIGGGASDAGVFDAGVSALAPGGRLVVNAVTLETEALLLERRGKLGGDLTRIAISRAEPVGGMSGWRPAMPVMQWAWSKP